LEWSSPALALEVWTGRVTSLVFVKTSPKSNCPDLGRLSTVSRELEIALGGRNKTCEESCLLVSSGTSRGVDGSSLT
jgi:hypothetical protein